MQNKTLTHIDEHNQPTMVDISDKSVSLRTAIACSRVELPANVLAQLNPDGEIISKKGPVFQTAIIAGTMAAKKTSELIPFCHQLPLDACKIHMQIIGSTLEITCEVRTIYKTGVEMEALTGASIAALTVYDMCKALSHEMIIRDTRLLSKSGGKSDYVGQ